MNFEKLHGSGEKRICHNLLLTVAVIGFTQADFTVIEGEDASVCVEVANADGVALIVEVTVTISTQSGSGSATGGHFLSGKYYAFRVSVCS